MITPLLYLFLDWAATAPAGATWAQFVAALLEALGQLLGALLDIILA